MTEATSESRAVLIKKLLTKAEAAGTTPEERDALNAKATELMVKWGIEEAMISQASADRLQTEKIIKRVITLDTVPKSYTYEYVMIGIDVAEALGCRGMYLKRQTDTVLIIVGFESDVDRVSLLATSLVLQCTLELSVWYRANVRDWHTGTDKFNMKRAFIMGYANGLRDKFKAWKRAALQDAAPGTDVAIRDRDAQVHDWVNQNMMLGTGRHRKYESGSAGAGWRAGQSADIGGSKLGGERRQIGG